MLVGEGTEGEEGFLSDCIKIIFSTLNTDICLKRVKSKWHDFKNQQAEEEGEHEQGQPQHRKNTTTASLPPPILKSPVPFGARLPTLGLTLATSIGGGSGVAHEFHDFGTVMFANGLSKGIKAVLLGVPSLFFA